MGSFLGKMFSNLGQNPLSGVGLAGNPLSGIGVLKKLMGGGDDHGGYDPTKQNNPGMKMFGGAGPTSNSHMGFLENFKNNFAEQLFSSAMNGFYNRGP